MISARLRFRAVLRTLLPAAALMLLASTAVPAPAQAILNVERRPAGGAGAHVAVEGAAELRVGNEDIVDLHGGLAAGYRWEGHWLRLLVGAEYLAEDNQRLVNARSLHLRYNRISDERWRTFHFVQLQANQALLLNRRFLLGSGVRAAVLGRGRNQLDVGTGLMLEDERLDRAELPAGEPAHARTIRAANLAVYRLALREGVEWLHVAYVQPFDTLATCACSMTRASPCRSRSGSPWRRAWSCATTADPHRGWSGGTSRSPQH
jgi:hypothetical protein